MAPELAGQLIDAVVAAIRAHADELTSLDQAIGDGDHGLNMRRGFDAIAAIREELAALPLGQALQKAGMALVMKVGGASGPLYGSLLMGMGKAAGDPPDVSLMLAEGVEAVKRRGKSEAGAKTMLDVLVPALEALRAGGGLEGVRAAAEHGLAATRDMQATKGRASYLGPRSIGHLDPGARSSALLIGAVCDVLEDSA
ncbi:MAG TPA: dihydroxyacetone kinase subunit DhaL [Geminicoccaceae bacterium]|nr:dihydroxyacetone kinase subunit DhaL [Geminicoccaceae bacterium]